MNEYTGITTCDDWRCKCGVRRADHHHAFERQKFPFVAMMRIRNEARWIDEVIRSTFQLCDRVFVMDDHSTDDTPAILRTIQAQHPDRIVILNSTFDGLNESRDKNWLYDQIIAACEPEWILCLDGDEVLEGPAGEAIRRTIDEQPQIQSWALKIEFLWNSPTRVRTDRIYGDFWRPSLFRPYHERPGVPDDRKLMQEFRFQSTPFGRRTDADKPNLHCSSVPQRRIHGFQRIPARLKHYGYMERDWRVAKLDYYTSIDWENPSEDCYRHMCQGDAPRLEELPRVRKLLEGGTLTAAQVEKLLDVPASARLLHAGPLVTTTWNEGQPWELSGWAKAQNAL